MNLYQVWSSRSAHAFKLAMVICAALAPASAGSQSNITRTYADYIAPSVNLVKTSKKPVSFTGLVEGTRPVVLEFFYTSCTTICGMQTSALAGARKALGTGITFVSVSIDPEYDTPARLSEYASNFPAGPNWHILTGKRSDITRILTAFKARPFGDNKMLHRPYIFIRPADGHQWVRLEGLANSKHIAAEVRSAIANPPPKSSTWIGVRKSINRMIGSQ